MSFTIVEQCTARLNRSELAVPGSNPKFLEKAAGSSADVIFLDLEDAVTPIICIAMLLILLNRRASILT